MTTLDFASARHLLARTGFGPRREEIEARVGRPVDEVVAELLEGVGPTPSGAPPDWVDEAPPGRFARKANKRKLRKQARERGLELKAWWLAEMVTTPSPLTERLVLMWHGHLTSSLRKVRWPTLMWRQQQLLREHALGDVGAMLRGIVRDPAMLIYLDNPRNRRGAPNENLGRELLELFTLGQGNGYDEADIKAAARALTGYSVDRNAGTFKFRRRQHDRGSKTFLGRTGKLDADDIVDVLLESPGTARHLVRRVWATFVSTAPEESVVDHLATTLRDGNYALRPVVASVLTSPAFLDPAERGRMVRGPVHLVVGTLRALALEDVLDARGARLVKLCRQLGQDLLDPPNVKGWPGGPGWLSATTLLARQQALRQLARRLGRDREADAETLLPLAPVQAAAADDALEALLLDPTYHLM